jgi:xanthine dehydrogenase accessory factor
MNDLGRTVPCLRPKPVLVLGTDDVASAVGHALADAGIAALLVRDPDVPVLRRGMSFDDALEHGSGWVDGVTAYAVDGPLDMAPDILLGVTALPVRELLDPTLIAGVIDARMRRRPNNPDLRGALCFAIGLGPGFTAGETVDMAVETEPGVIGQIVTHGATRPAPGRASMLGDIGEERFGHAPRSGVWWTFRDIGETVEAGAVIGLCDGMQVAAPLDGRLRGLVRRGSEVRAGTRLLEIDPRREGSQCHGLCPRAITIAAATLTALHAVWQPQRLVLPQEMTRWLM